MRPPIRRLFALSVLLAASAVAAPPAEIALTAAQIQALAVVTAAPEATPATELQGLAAEVMVPNNQLHVVSTALAGLVESVLVAVNEPVRRGQVMARMQSTALAEAQRAYLQAHTQMRLAQANLDRDRKLAAEGLIAESRLLSTQAGQAEATALLAERRHALRLAGMNDEAVSRLEGGQAITSAVTITAPADGVVVEQMAQAGQRLEAFAPLYKIARLDPLWLEIQVPLARAAGVREGAAVRVPAAEASGRIISVGKRVTPESQTLMLRALVSTNAQRLRPGQYVEASVGVPEGGPARWRVPASAMARVRDELLLFVRSPRGFRVVPVTLVNEGSAGAVVAGPLEAGSQVAVQGVSALKAKLLDGTR